MLKRNNRTIAEKLTDYAVQIGLLFGLLCCCYMLAVQSATKLIIFLLELLMTITKPVSSFWFGDCFAIVLLSYPSPSESWWAMEHDQCANYPILNLF